MAEINFNKLYNEKEEYLEIRDVNSDVYKNYINIIINWKLKFLMEMIPKGLQFKNVMEVGSATGDLLNYLPLSIPENKRLGLDISDVNVEVAKKRYPRINFKCEPFENFAESMNENIDLIIFSDIIEHVPNDLEFMQIAAHKSRYLLFNLPLEKCWEFRNREYGPDDFRGHLKAYNLEDARELAKKGGFEIVNEEVKYYVMQPIFKDYLKIKLVKDKRGLSKLLGYVKFIYEILEIKIRYKRYKSNYFALLKSTYV